MSMIRNRTTAWAFGALWIPAAIAAGTTAETPANTSGVMPGDDALTCEQIYAQGMAESQRKQEAINQRNEQMKRQSAGTGALVTGAMVTGGSAAPESRRNGLPRRRPTARWPCSRNLRKPIRGSTT